MPLLKVCTHLDTIKSTAEPLQFNINFRQHSPTLRHFPVFLLPGIPSTFSCLGPQTTDCSFSIIFAWTTSLTETLLIFFFFLKQAPHNEGPVLTATFLEFKSYLWNSEAKCCARASVKQTPPMLSSVFVASTRYIPLFTSMTVIESDVPPSL